MINLTDKEVLITGGTGSLGKAIVNILLSYGVKGIRIYSRDEYKQWLMKREFSHLDANISYLIGDIRDYNRLSRAMNGVDVVYNAAAMKQVPACEYNPEESIKTNIQGAQNVLNACIDNNVDVCMHVSTDKAVYPVNLYGACKTVAEHLFIHGNVYTGDRHPFFSVCRYGNVLNSRGSIIPLFKEQKEKGKITITDIEMTRFLTSLETVANICAQNGKCQSH
jgi:FlaA1/EpsC-like NDP-sugar epimerase